MSIANKLLQIAENVPKVYEAGQKSEQDSFWDSYQNKGSAVNGTYMFSGHGWNDKIYAPKYPIKLSVGTGLFAFSDITDTKVEIDFTKTSGGDTHVFNWGQCFTNITMLKVNENTSYSNWFNYCTALEEIRFEGVIGKILDLHWSTKLSAESYYSIITALSSSVSGQKLIVPPTAKATYNANPPQGEGVPQTWAELIGTKSNWTIAES